MMSRIREENAETLWYVDSCVERHLVKQMTVYDTTRSGLGSHFY